MEGPELSSTNRRLTEENSGELRCRSLLVEYVLPLLLRIRHNFVFAEPVQALIVLRQIDSSCVGTFVAGNLY